MTQLERINAVEQEIDAMDKLGNHILDLSDDFIRLLEIEELKLDPQSDDIMKMHELQMQIFSLAKERLDRIRVSNF